MDQMNLRWIRTTHDTEFPEDQPEEQSVPTVCEGFCIQIKSKSKTKKKGTCWLFT